MKTDALLAKITQKFAMLASLVSPRIYPIKRSAKQYRLRHQTEARARQNHLVTEPTVLPAVLVITRARPAMARHRAIASSAPVPKATYELFLITVALPRMRMESVVDLME